MSYLLEALLVRKLLCLSISISYFIAVVLPHDFVGAQIYTWLFNGSIPEYNQTFLVIVGSGVVLVVPAIGLKLRRSEGVAWRLVCIGSLIFLMTGAYFSIMVLATETIHWPQYAMMAILLYPLTRHIGDTLIWTTLLGAIDEGWQYFALGSSDYYDFNDVVLNFLGAVFGLWIVSLYAATSRKKEARSAFTPAVLCFLLILIAGIIGILCGIIQLSGASEHAGMLTLSPLKPAAFWSAFHDDLFHIVRAWEALLLLVILYHLYCWLLHRIMSQKVINQL